MSLKGTIEEHRITFPRAIVGGIVITIIPYSLGVILVDIMEIKYYIAGILIILIIFTTKYALNKYWVFKKVKAKVLNA